MDGSVRWREEGQISPDEHARGRVQSTPRRRFLAGLASVAFAPILLGALPGCRKRSAPAPGGPPSAEAPAALAEEVVQDAVNHPPIPSVEPFVRVRVARIRSLMPGGSDVDLDADGESDDRSRHMVEIGEQGQMLRLVQPDSVRHHLTAFGPVEITIGAGGWSVIDRRGFRLPLFNLTPIHILPLDQQQDGDELLMSERRYPGMLSLFPMTQNGPADFDVVNHVRIEAYLPGVVFRELYNHWHPEAHAAQAIAARSFACAERAWWATRRHFDLTNTQQSQAYAGSVTHQRSLDAVAKTRGKVIAHNGHLVPAYYSSCCGGLPAYAVDAIGPNRINDIPPLKGNGSPDVCVHAPAATWSASYSRQVIVTRLAAYGRANRHAELADLDTLQAIDVAAVNQHGRPTQYVLVNRAGDSVAIGAETLRRAINHADGTMGRLRRSLRSSHFTATFEGSDIVFDGRGYGHGVGMCQHGAELRARNGQAHHEILKWYYPGAEIVSAYA